MKPIFSRGVFLFAKVAKKTLSVIITLNRLPQTQEKTLKKSDKRILLIFLIAFIVASFNCRQINIINIKAASKSTKVASPVSSKWIKSGKYEGMTVDSHISFLTVFTSFFVRRVNLSFQLLDYPVFLIQSFVFRIQSLVFLVQ